MKNTLLTLVLFVLALACQNTVPAPDPKQEEKGIIACIEAESKAWVNRDSVAWLACYAQLPNSTQVWNNRNGTWDAIRGWDNIFTENMKSYRSDRNKRTDILEGTNYQIQMCGPDWAWVTFDQTIRRDRGREFANFEYRVMTKIKGEWKLVGNASLWNYSKTANIGDLLSGQQGKVVRHESSLGSSEWLIETVLFGKTMALYPIGLPDALKKEGQPITFDGEFLYGKHQLYKPGAENKPVPDVAVNYVRVDAVR
ncbi:MAG: nuclear transport factor 2 family protein [Bacteroidetes bacterium]|nr:MAG: nuclear transport factor 2 family protein [Bacteroidota bacterium]